MGIPQKVKEQGERADQMASEVYDQTTGKRKDPNQPPQTVDAPEKTPSDDKSTASGGEEDVDWKKRFQGLSKTHREMKDAYKQLEQQNEQLMQRLESIEQQMTKKAPEPAADPNKSMEERLKAMMSEDEREQYDDNFIAMLARFFNTGSSQQDNSALEDRLNKVEKVQTMTVKDRFWKEINENVPNWQAIQESPEFDEWASQYDPFLKTTRWKALEGTMSSLDHELAIGIFDQFTRLKAKPASQGDQHADQSIENDPRLSQVVPDNAAGGTGVDDDGKPYFKQSFINQFYKDVSLGHYNGKEQEAASIDKQIFEAGQAGRIIPD